MNLPAPVLCVGPATIRALRVESLDGRGKRVQVGSFVEKPCQHGYIDGTITGRTPAPQSSWARWYCHWESFSGDSVQVEQFPFRMGTLTAHVNCEFSEDEVSASLSVSFFTEARTKTGVLVDTISNSCVVRAIRTEDEATGTVVYSNWAIVARSGSRCEQITATTVPNPYGVGTDSLLAVLDQVKGYLTKVQADEEAKKKPKYKNTRDVAIYEAVENMALSNVNWLETFKDLAEPLAAIRQLLKFFSGGWGWKSILRKLASLHLFWKYVIKTGILTATDIAKLLKLLAANHGNVVKLICASHMIGHGRSKDEETNDDGCKVAVEWFAKVVYGPDVSSLNAFLARISSLGLIPKVGDLWDLVPWSFVIDWLIPIGDYLYHLEEMSNVQQLPLLSCVITCKSTSQVKHSFKVNNVMFDFDGKVVNYNRVAQTTLPSDMWLGVRFRDPRKQILTATALLIQLIVKD